MKILAYFIGAVGVIALIAGIVLLFTFPIMWALNYVFTPAVLMALFGVSKLTFWKTFVLSWVIGTMFKGTTTTTKKS
jgi:hypothetical protein